MPHLLHIDSSVLGEQSVSRRLTARPAERWRAARPCGTVTYRDLATDPIPHLDAETGAARHLPAEFRTPAHQASFALSAELIDEIKRADTVLLGLPLYNYGPPSAVKAWIDHIVAPGLSTDPETGAGWSATPTSSCLPAVAADTARALPAKAGITTRPGCPTPWRRFDCSRNSSPPNSPPPQSIPRRPS
jgi:hypothetical protein